MHSLTKKKRGSVVWLEYNSAYHIAVVVSKQNGVVGVNWGKGVAAGKPQLEEMGEEEFVERLAKPSDH